MDNIEFGKNLEAVRVGLNFTQGYVAKKLNISSQSVSKWEKGLSLPSLDLFFEIVKLYNKSADELLLINLNKQNADSMLLSIYKKFKNGEKIASDTELFVQRILPVNPEKNDANWVMGARDFIAGLIYAILEDEKLNNKGLSLDILKKLSLANFIGENSEKQNLLKEFFKDKSDKAKSLAVAVIMNATATFASFMGIVYLALNNKS